MSLPAIKIIDKKSIEEIVSTDERFEVKNVTVDDFKAILDVRYKEKGENLNAILKINWDWITEEHPNGDGRSEKKAYMEYSVFERLKDKSHIFDLIRNSEGLGPLIFQSKDGRKYYGVLSREAEYSLKNYIEVGNKFSEKEALEMIVKLAKGLRELKYAGSRHRDIRTSNILFYKDKGWVLADFGNSAIDQEILTHSSRTIDAYLSNENRYLKEEELKIPFDHNEDIWQLGVTYYCVLKGIHTPTLWKEYKDKRRKNRKLHFYEFLYDKINSENFEEKTKYYLKRLMGMMEREDVPKDCIIEDVHPFGPHPNDGIPKTMENDVKRYRVIDEFIDEYEGKPKPDFNPTTDIIVSTYEKKVEKVRDILVEAEKNRDPYLHLIEDRYIESLTTEVKSLQEFCSGSDKEKIADKYLDFMEEINLLIDKEYKKIDEEIDKVIINFNNKNSQESLYSNEILRVFYEKIFLWGPPFTESKRERPEEKAKYSFKETMDCNTHYHKEKNWTSFVNLRTRNELLKKVAEYI